MDILSKLGIDLNLLVLQIVNFSLLAGLLTYLLYKPVLNVIAERKRRIAESEEKAAKVSKEYEDAQKKVADELGKAHKEAREIIEQAKKSAKAVEEQMVEEAKKKAEKTLLEGKTQLALEREKVASELQSTVAELVTAATAKILAKETSDKERDAAINEALREIAKAK